MVTDTEGRTFRAPSYTTEIYVGNSPVITPVNGVAAYHGNYGSAREHALLKASLPVGASIDLTEVSHYIDDPSIFLSGNVFFRNDLVAYGRKVSTQWGTLCLPYAVQSNDSLQFYTLVAASYNALTFEKAASIDANTPTLFKATGSSFIVSTSNDGSIPVDFASLGTNLSLPQQAIGWTFNGSYTDQTINSSQMRAYTLSQDKFILAGKSLQVKAFNAWLRDNAAPVASSLSIIEKEGSALPVIELPDGSVQLYYDLHGRPQPTPQPNQIHISPHQKSILTP